MCAIDRLHTCEGRIEAAHVRRGTDGAMGVKPSDNYALPLCEAAHRLQHKIGEESFEMLFGISMLERAAYYWRIWLHKTEPGQRYRIKERESA